MTDVYVCYAPSDLGFARRLAEALRDRAADVFVDLGEWWHDAGHDESEAIARHATPRSANAVLVVVSPALAASGACRQEVEMAVARRQRIIPLAVEETAPETLPDQLRKLDHLPFRKEGFDTGVARLIEVLEQDSSRAGVRGLVRAHRWLLIGIMALVCLGLGMWGYTDLYPTLPWIDRLYVSLALFRDTTTLYGGIHSAPRLPPPFPWPLEVARWLSPLTLVLAGLSALFAVLAEPFTRLRVRSFYRRHLVVCGLGHFGLRLAAAFRARGERVVVVDWAPASVALSRCRELSIPVLAGDATDPEVLRGAGVGRASRLVAVCGDNTVNDRIGVAAKRVVASGERAGNRRGHLDCFVHVDDDQMCQRLEQSSLAETDQKSVAISYVNVFRSGGIALLRAFPHSFAERDGRAPHLVVVGPDRVGLLVVVGAVREWWFDHRGDGPRLDLTLVTADAKERAGSLRRRHPHFDEACRLSSHDCDPADPMSDRLPSLGDEGDWERTTVIVSYPDEGASLEATMKLAGEVPPHVPIVVLTAGQTGPVTMIDRATSHLHYSNVATFPLLDRLCRPDVFVNSVTEQMARALHESYLEHRRLDGTLDPARPSHQPWEMLEDTFRASNRDAARQFAARLDQAGYAVRLSDDWDVPLPAFSVDEVNRLAESEHQRWCEERRAAGWVFAPHLIEPDVEHKRHPDLVAWSELAESRRELDREAQRELPALLARHGLAIVRKEPAVGGRG